MIDTLTYQIYAYATTGMFEKHKLLFSFLMTLQIELDKKNLQPKQIDFFLKGNISLDKSLTIKSKPKFPWLTDDAWHHCRYLAEHFPDQFHDLLKNIEEHPSVWKEWIEEDPSPLPKPFDQTLNAFEQLMLLRCFAPHRIILAISDYVTKLMGEKFLVPPTIHFDAIFEQSTPSIPVIFVLSPGSDPTNDLQKLVERKNQTNYRKMNVDPVSNVDEQKFLRILAMGQGQEKIALQALHTAQHQGTWLLLQNCHLLLPFLSELEKTLETMNKPHVRPSRCIVRFCAIFDFSPIFVFG